MKKLIMMLLMIGFGYSQSLPQPIIVGEELDYPTLKISQFVKVDELVDQATDCTASALTTKSSASNLLNPIFMLF